MPIHVNTIRTLRLRLGITQAEAARRAGMKYASQWSEVERGDKPDPQLSTAERIAEVLGVTVDALTQKAE
ncbi:MAG: helix-turn-helix transcriptional regulator [Planctomycetota bacterium]